MDSGESDGTFILRDDTGECVVDPEQAEIFTRHRDQWLDGDYRYTEWKLIEHDSLYVIGQFRTQGGSSVEFDSNAELNAMLAEWKKDMPALLKRFDLDNDGTLNAQEWMLARSAAGREVAKMIREAQAQADINIIKPATLRRTVPGQQSRSGQIIAPLFAMELGASGDILRSIGRDRLGAAISTFLKAPCNPIKRAGFRTRPCIRVCTNQSFLRSIMRSIKPSFVMN